jgi:hypothetical protein
MYCSCSGSSWSLKQEPHKLRKVLERGVKDLVIPDCLQRWDFSLWWLFLLICLLSSHLSKHNSLLMFSPFLSVTKASANSAPCSRPVQAAVFALLTSSVFQRLCWGNRRCGEKFISSNPSHQNCTTQSMRYGLIIFIATTTDLLYLNWGLCVIDTEGLMYLSFTVHK